MRAGANSIMIFRLKSTAQRQASRFWPCDIQAPPQTMGTRTTKLWEKPSAKYLYLCDRSLHPVCVCVYAKGGGRKNHVCGFPARWESVCCCCQLASCVTNEFNDCHHAHYAKHQKYFPVLLCASSTLV